MRHDCKIEKFDDYFQLLFRMTAIDAFEMKKKELMISNKTMSKDMEASIC